MIRFTVHEIWAPGYMLDKAESQYNRHTLRCIKDRHAAAALPMAWLY